MIKQFAPTLKVSLVTSRGTEDITPDCETINIRRRMGEPSGMWSITLTPRKDSAGRTWFDKIRPMDQIEIRFARQWSKRLSPPLQFRGYVDNTRRTYSFDGGKPQRSIMVNGRCSGKLLVNWKVYYLYEMDPVSGLLNHNRLEANFGIPPSEGGDGLRPGRFVQLVNQNIIEPEISTLRRHNKHVKSFRVVTEGLPSYYRVNGFAVQPYTGSIWNLLQMYGNKPWCELFVLDTEEQPLLIYRPTPFKNRQGKLAQSYDPDNTSLFRTLSLSSDSFITQEDLGYSDNEVFSYFFTYPSQSLMAKVAYKSQVIGTDFRNPNADVYNTSKATNPTVIKTNMEIYGFRPLEIETPCIPLWPGSQVGDVVPQDVRNVAASMNKWLVDVFAHNQHLLNGTLTCAGLDEHAIGRYIRTSNMEFYSEGYETEIDIKSTSFTTKLYVTRGREV